MKTRNGPKRAKARRKAWPSPSSMPSLSQDICGRPARCARAISRAASVVAYLVKQGIDQTRLESEGYGATQPLVPNLTPANRAKNRRVAFKIIDSAAPVVP